MILKDISDLTEIGQTREVVLEEQRKDLYSRGKVEDIEAGQELGFVLSTDGLLYKGETLNGVQLVAPEMLPGPSFRCIMTRCLQDTRVLNKPEIYGSCTITG